MYLSVSSCLSLSVSFSSPCVSLCCLSIFLFSTCESPFPPPPLHPCLGLGADSAWGGNSTGIREPLPHVGTAYSLPLAGPIPMLQLLNALGETPLRERPPMSPLPLAGGPASFFLPPAQ